MQLHLVVFGRKGQPNYRVESIHTDAAEARQAVANHPHANSRITSASDKARVVKFDLGLLAWDVSDAFAKDDDSPFDFGGDEIQAALPAFITAMLAINNAN